MSVNKKEKQVKGDLLWQKMKNLKRYLLEDMIK